VPVVVAYVNVVRLDATFSTPRFATLAPRPENIAAAVLETFLTVVVSVACANPRVTAALKVAFTFSILVSFLGVIAVLTSTFNVSVPVPPSSTS
jgi:hypothetical protein